ncbi:MAG TPA: hypothetical protein VIG88_08465 [Lysobacter sp.]
MRAGSLQSATKPRPARGFVVFRWCVYALLALDVLLYARYGRATELLDTAAWVVLVLLFEWETGGWRLASRMRPLLHGARALAACAVVVAVAGYALEREWLDFANEATWLGVVALLELDVRLPPRFRRAHRLRRRASALLYAALGAFLLAWMLEGLAGDGAGQAWLDTWDAALWLVAFWVIELNVFGWAARAPRRR